ncbi:MAG: GNAT family N-acetyltransferase [Candidatus Omnitrophica bacterium]|nr:GNAT family N-acetyltransferase [Candidatus Omnitrophota bacterium]
MANTQTQIQSDVVIRPLVEKDLPAADQVMRVAFGTYVGIPEPSTFFGDSDYANTRWRAHPKDTFVAEANGEIVGSAFVTWWGSFALFGPLTIRPDYWDRGLGRRLMEPVVDLFEGRNIRLAGLFTFPDSAKHLGLYQKFGFHPMCLTAVMSKEIEPVKSSLEWTRFSQHSEAEQKQCLGKCREATDSIYEGLDLTHEIQSIQHQGLGDTVLLWRNSKLVGFAACHSGPGTEARSGTCYVKFGACKTSDRASEDFQILLAACQEFAVSVGQPRLMAGVNTARREAYYQMQRSGFRTEFLGIAMHRPSEPGWSRPGDYVIDDWR